MTAKIYYNSTDGTGLVVYPDDLGYATVPEPFIVVDRVTMQDVFDNRDRRKVDLKTLQIVQCDPPAPIIADVQAAKWNEIKVERDRREQTGCSYLGKIIDSTQVAVQRITVAVQAAQAAIAAGTKDFSLDWTCSDNSTLTMTAAQVCGMSVALAQNSDALHKTARQLRTAIEAAKTVEDVAKVVWPPDAVTK